ncbi:hypothetical protein CDD82_6676 [Ophiocordyceps australis]|uniref:Helicase ATP-binding domain-containing protein n=1 Tax=Ophiocordyceps australis TaxID=1399860 RepID=A0A2C5YTY7_9HYPO|nr:hypothetical protein CDD82_6676 [Ophiocordyceps australis]
MLRDAASNANVDCVVEWPALFKSLEQTHRALNVVFTFCSTRKHLATTLDRLRPAVETHIKKHLTSYEIAQVVALRPEGIKFEYVDELMLQLDVRGSERDDTFRTSGSASSQARTHDSSVGGFTGDESFDCNKATDARALSDRQVLFFEFVDNDLKRQVTDKKTGQAVQPRRKLRDEELRLPVYSQKQLVDVIERRNQKFANAISLFLNSCVEDDKDPHMVLEQRAEAYMPKRLAQDGVDMAHLSHLSGPMATIPETIPEQRQSIATIVEELKSSPWYSGQIVPDGHRVFEAQEPVYGHLDFQLSQNLVNALYNAKGIARFYAHQAEALNSLNRGHNVVVATSTSSGKSLIYQLPVLRALEQDGDSRAMFIFPTKALAQDQKRSLREMLAYMPQLEETMVETFDGDTPMCERDSIRQKAKVIFTNPDMLHMALLPQEERWRSFFRSLRYVVVDELHHYNGLLGSHVAFIMRRLRRVCAAIGNKHVSFVSCSATVANPKKHFEAIFGTPGVCLVDYDGSPSGRKEFLCWNTPFREPGDPASGRGNAKLECARLFCALMLRGVRMIAFCRVRAQCEALVREIRLQLESLGRSDCTGLVMGYRGGYTAADRRRLEADMSEGRLMGIVATTALELGIDIGALDCVLTWGFPYTISNLRQQSGRAGRRNKDSLCILLGDGFPTDQHYMQNPSELFTKPNCELGIDLDNMLVREGHLQCAAYEIPLWPDQDCEYFGHDLAAVCQERLLKDELGFYHCHDRFRPTPCKFVSIRESQEDHFAIVDTTNGRQQVLEEVEASRATFTIYDGAIFLHQGETYLVRDFAPQRLMARVEKVKVDWTTTQRDYTDVDPIETEAIGLISSSPSRAYYGTIKVQQHVFGYFKVDSKGRVLDAVQVDNGPVIRYSKGMWLDVPRRALDILEQRRLNAAAAIHAAEHAVMSLLPTFVVSMPGEVRTECKVAAKEFAQRPTRRRRPARLTLYDAKGGAQGSGLSTKAFDHVDGLLRMALQRVEGCQCRRGCLECVASETCKHANEVMSKAGARVILCALLNLDIDLDALPLGPEDDNLVGHDTIVPAQPVPTRSGQVSCSQPLSAQHGTLSTE